MFVSETLTYTSATDAEMPRTDLNRTFNTRLCILAIMLNFRYYFVDKIPLILRSMDLKPSYSWSYTLK